ncbi:MAG: hypothetical protein L6R36_005633 [Xanthoria steineri]|nr:MAG: hypothetical protein L6R36_005633 [Xanthoria steineri]
MLVHFIFSYLLGLVAAIAIPATAPPYLPQSLTAGGFPNPWPFTRRVTYDVPGSDVRLTLTSNTGSRVINPERISILISTGLHALGNSEDDAGGPFKDVNQPQTRWTEVGIRITVDDKTLDLPNPEADGGRMKWGELRAIYQGTGAHMKDIGNEECKIEAWRVATSGYPRRERRIKLLASGTLKAAPTAARIGSPPNNGTQTA